jgi:hypothetical protein
MVELVLSKISTFAKQYRDQGHYPAYYAIPVLIGFTITYLLIQIIVYLFPELGFSVNGYHVHHYTYGVATVLVFGYVGLWAQSEKVKIISAVAHGVGAAFIIDEAFMWFTLNPAPGYQDYNLPIIVVALLLGFILVPLFYRKESED